MPEVKPFKGIIYNPNKVSIEKVVAPPYDVISDMERDELYELSEYNVIRLILNKDKDRYLSAKRFFERWLEENILIEIEDESIYVYEQEFTSHMPGRWGKFKRAGVILLVKLEEFGSGNIFPHERTSPKPKEDRFNLLKATNAQFDQIFGIYPDPDGRIDNLIEETSKKLIFNFVFQNVKHKLFQITDNRLINRIRYEFAEKSIFIADGHHRYETGLLYREYMKSRNPEHSGKEGYNYILMYLTNMDSESLVILPTHRIIHGLEIFDKSSFISRVGDYFYIEEFEMMDEALSNLKGKRWCLCAFTGDKFYLLRLKSKDIIDKFAKADVPEVVRELDVSVLHSIILRGILGISDESQERGGNISYTHDIESAIREVKRGSGQVAFIMNPVKIEEVRRISRSGITMPQKSTYFYPKLLSGIVMRRI
jgi:uncharacterized protein (DUF1015 family)